MSWWPFGTCSGWEQPSHDGSKIATAPTPRRPRLLVLLMGDMGFFNGRCDYAQATSIVSSAKARMVPAIIGAAAAVIAAVLGAVVVGRRSGAVEGQKFRREIRAPMYSDFTEKAQALTRELQSIGFTLASAAANRPVTDTSTAWHNKSGGRRARDWRTTSYRQAHDEFLEAADRVMINGSRRARHSVELMRKLAVDTNGRLSLDDTQFGELSADFRRYVHLFDKARQRAVSVFRSDLGTTD